MGVRTTAHYAIALAAVFSCASPPAAPTPITTEPLRLCVITGAQHWGPLHPCVEMCLDGSVDGVVRPGGPPLPCKLVLEAFQQEA